jgi:hypothetical protein
MIFRSSASSKTSEISFPDHAITARAGMFAGSPSCTFTVKGLVRQVSASVPLPEIFAMEKLESVPF